MPLSPPSPGAASVTSLDCSPFAAPEEHVVAPGAASLACSQDIDLLRAEADVPGVSGAAQIHGSSLHLRQALFRGRVAPEARPHHPPQQQEGEGDGQEQFSQLEYAKTAQSLNGQLDIAGRVIKVSAVTD
ncbi:hypothetical protein ZWY2020_041134 [Hordeum vulgare]|nr:hypothetical protein ZWY2020_041134 [Hordeum vulgare]